MDWKLAKLLADRYAVTILQALKKGPNDVQSISNENDIPRNSCYKRMRELRKYELVDVNRIEEGETRPMIIYERKVDSITMGFDDNSEFYIKLDDKLIK